jgi:hypothetical protein
MGGSSGKPGKGGYKGGTTRPLIPAIIGAGVFGGGDAPNDPCAFDMQVSLASPVPAVVAGLAQGDILHVALNSAGPNPVAEVHDGNNQVAGTLAGIPHLRALIGCLQQGAAYVVEVTMISGGRVDGHLRNA